MEIKRKFEVLIATHCRYIIRQSPRGGQAACAGCGVPMLTAEQTATVFGITQRSVFRIIETGAVHFTETSAGAVLICPATTAAYFTDDQAEAGAETAN